MYMKESIEDVKSIGDECKAIQLHSFFIASIHTLWYHLSDDVGDKRVSYPRHESPAHMTVRADSITPGTVVGFLPVGMRVRVSEIIYNVITKPWRPHSN